MTARSLGAVLCAGVWACSDSVGPPPVPPAEAVAAVVSEPVVLPASGGSLTSAFATSNEQVPGNTYVSLPPGTIPRGKTLTIKNTRTAGTATAPLIDGGSDPVFLPASAGDTLEMIALDSSGVRMPFLRIVPSRLPPVVVRTRPPRGGRGVPLNLNLGAVFSEPIQTATANSTTVLLTLGGVAVPGSVRPSVDGVTLDYVLDQPLLPNVEYTLRITRGIRDISGDQLQEEIETRFTTGTVDPSLGVIAFTRGSGMDIFAPGYVWDIWTARADGSQARNITNHSANDFGPDWSPDGSQIAFTTDRSGLRGVYVMKPDGSDVRRLIPGQFEDFSPAWSPDGTRIAFARKTGEFESQILIARSDGSGAVAITSGAGLRYSPSWSPDGQRIAHTYHRHSGGLYQPPNVHIAAADGSGASDITKLGSSANTCPFARDPSWSQDGMTILVYGCPPGQTPFLGVHRMNPDGSNFARVGTVGAIGWDPKWTHGGQRIMFVKDRKLYGMTALGTEVIQITFGSDADQNPDWHP